MLCFQLQESAWLHRGLTAGCPYIGIRDIDYYCVKAESLAATLTRHLDQIVSQKAAAQNVVRHTSG